MFFYHSFPRKPNQQDHELGLKILASILKRGLLITPELRIFPAYNDLPSAAIIQRRVCFTALPTNEISKHSQFFGEFSLEFDGAALRGFSALPALYLTGRLLGGEMFDAAGDMVSRVLLEASLTLYKLWKLNDEGTEEEKAWAKTVLQKLKVENITVQELHFATDTLLNLYYPTDDQAHFGRFTITSSASGRSFRISLRTTLGTMSSSMSRLARRCLS